MGPIQVVVQDGNNLVLEVTPTPSTTVILDRGIAGPPGPEGTGDVSGPASSTDNALARFDGTTGKLIQNSVGILSDAGLLSGLTTVDTTNLEVTSVKALDGTAAFAIANTTGVMSIDDTKFTLQDNADTTKKAQFELSGNTTATTRIYTLPNLTGSLATIGTLTQTFSGTTTFSGATVTVGSSTATSTYGLGSGATASGSTKTINFGTGGLAGSITNIAIGSVAGTSTTTVNGNFAANLANSTNLPLSTGVTGTLPVANGGTGTTSLTANNVILGNGTSAVQVVAPGTNGNVLTSNGTTWISQAVPSSMVYPGAGMAVSTGTAWGTSKTTPAGDVVGTTDTQTLTNKRVTPRSLDIASSATITPPSDTADQYEITALATAATIAAPSGTPTDGQKLVLRFKDNGTARALTWTTTSGAYRAIGVTLPTTTVLSKVLYVGCIWNAQDSFWDVIALAQQA
jgi:hypothetical protein